MIQFGSGGFGRGVATAMLIAGLAVTAVAQDDAATALDGATPAERVAKTTQLETTDPAKVLDAFAALRERKFKKGEADPHLDFLAAYIVQEPTRTLRLAAVGAGVTLGREGLAERLRAQADGTDRFKSSVAAEALGYTGGEADWETLLKLANSPSLSISVRACEALAKMGEKDQADRLIEIALDHPNVEVADHATWASLDILKKQKSLVAKLKRAAGKDAASPRGIRNSAIVAMLEDGAKPHSWDEPLEKLFDLHAGSSKRKPLEIKALDDSRRQKVAASLAWLKEKLPGVHLQVHMAVDSIQFPGSPADSHMDLDKYAVCIPMSYSGQNERQLAYHIVRVAGVLLEKRLGNPHIGHRGWENAIFDTYDVCAEAGLYNAGKGGINRDQFLDSIIPQRPWGGN